MDRAVLWVDRVAVRQAGAASRVVTFSAAVPGGCRWRAGCRCGDVLVHEPDVAAGGAVVRGLEVCGRLGARSLGSRPAHAGRGRSDAGLVPGVPQTHRTRSEAWAELLTNRSGLLSRRLVRALRTGTVLPARLQRNHLDVPVSVADLTTLRTLQSPAWHPALEKVLRRHVQRPFYLDVLLVFDYDTMPAHRNGHGAVGSPRPQAWWTAPWKLVLRGRTA